MPRDVPPGSRLTQFPGWPDEAEAHARIVEALPYLRHIQNTSSFWGVRIILRDLYGWTDPIDDRNWRTLDALIRERADDRSWPREVLDRARIERTGTELARRGGGEDDDRLQYALEWGFFTRCQWGEYDTALYELERCWGEVAGEPRADRGGRPARRRIERSATSTTSTPPSPITSTASPTARSCRRPRISRPTSITARSRTTRWPLRSARRDRAGPAERDCYASYVNEAFLTALEAHGEEIVFQFSFGAEPLPFETGSRLSQRTIGQVADLIGRHPRLRFQCFLASRSANQAMCTLARELPNFSLAGYWWHNFFPDTIAQVIRERLEMLPANKQIGFFSDAYCAEWSYAKAVIVRKILARVLAERIELGQLDEPAALEFAAVDPV